MKKFHIEGQVTLAFEYDLEAETEEEAREIAEDIDGWFSVDNAFHLDFPTETVEGTESIDNYLEADITDVEEVDD